jgi:HSP20 family protein
MPSHEIQPREHEEGAFWPVSDWPFFRGFMPALRGMLPSSDLSVWEDKDHVWVKAALPGISPDEVDLSYERGILTVRTQKNEEKEDKERKYFYKSNSSYIYRLSVPGDIDEGSEPNAKLENGVILVSFKKHTKAASRKIHVKGS